MDGHTSCVYVFDVSSHFHHKPLFPSCHLPPLCLLSTFNAVHLQRIFTKPECFVHTEAFSTCTDFVQSCTAHKIHPASCHMASWNFYRGLWLNVNSNCHSCTSTLCFASCLIGCRLLVGALYGNSMWEWYQTLKKIYKVIKLSTIFNITDS